ncbi:MAG: CRISPR-associated endonuclease Cas2 [Anaerolineae bacterium]|nr:CRISPR-associated endonuclease Cas2 [Anaerolineae bacterium]
MFVVVAYDIADDKRRIKVMKLLEGYGTHMQESVFECNLEAPVYREMVSRLRKSIRADQDNVRLYHLCHADIKRIEQIGIGLPAPWMQTFRIV